MKSLLIGALALAVAVPVWAAKPQPEPEVNRVVLTTLVGYVTWEYEVHAYCKIINRSDVAIPLEIAFCIQEDPANDPLQPPDPADCSYSVTATAYPEQINYLGLGENYWEGVIPMPDGYDGEAYEGYTRVTYSGVGSEIGAFLLLDRSARDSIC